MAALISWAASAVSTASPIALCVVAIVIAFGVAAVVVTMRGEALEASEKERAAAEQHRLRQQDLVARFGAEAAAAIIARRVWMGATEEMAVEALGAPAAVDERVYKTKTKRVLKFQPVGRGYGLRVTCENGLVVGWDDKSSKS